MLLESLRGRIHNLLFLNLQFQLSTKGFLHILSFHDVFLFAAFLVLSLFWNYFEWLGKGSDFLLFLVFATPA